LFPDNTFFLRMAYEGKPEPNTFDDIGRWALTKEGTLVLRGGREGPLFFRPREGQSLTKLDIKGKPIESAQNYDLARATTFAAIEPRLPLRGMYSYMADAAWFKECLTGNRLAVAQEGDYDDDSTDQTAARALAAVPYAEHVRVVRGGPLPPSWRGRPHACHRLRQATEAEVLVFADADVTPAPGTLIRAAGALATLGVAAVSALPSHQSPSLAVRAVAAFQNWAPLAFVPLWLGTLARRPLFAVLNGQFLAIGADAYDAIGGFAAVRDSLGEDTALGRRLVAGGYRIALLDGTDVLTCHPYARLGELWRANVRNLAAIFFGATALLAGAMTGLAILYLGPFALLALGAVAAHPAPMWPWAPLAAIVLGLIPRAAVDRRARYAPGLVLLHPLAVAVLIAMAADSALRRHRLGHVTWRGRDYPLTSPGARHRPTDTPPPTQRPGRSLPAALARWRATRRTPPASTPPTLPPAR
jgi:chlorobactene glucosyltransferase